MIVVGKLCKWQERSLVRLSVVHKGTEVLLQLLIYPLGLPISLRMIGCRQGTSDPQSPEELL